MNKEFWDAISLLRISYIHKHHADVLKSYELYSKKPTVMQQVLHFVEL